MMMQAWKKKMTWIDDSQEDEVNIVNPDDPDDNDRGEVPGEDDERH